MPTRLKSETARRNGAKSRGPVTEAGKRASSLNAVKHGIHSSLIVLVMEDQQAYDLLLAGYLERYQPGDTVEEALVVDMVNARWRMQRSQHLETAILNLRTKELIQEQGEQAKSATVGDITAVAYHLLLNESRTLTQLQRQEARLHRIYHRSLDQLRALQAGRRAAEEAAAEAETAAAAEGQPSETAETEKSQNEPTAQQSPLTGNTPAPNGRTSPRPTPLRPPLAIGPRATPHTR